MPSKLQDGEWLQANYPELEKQLSENDYLTYLVALLLQRWDYHVNKVQTSRFLYNSTGWLLVFAIPILSAFITWATNGGNWLLNGHPLGVLSLILTLLTLLSSVLKPLQRTTQADHQLVALYTWRYKLLCEVRAKLLASDSDFTAYLSARDAELSQIGNQMVNTLIPDDSASNRNGSQNDNSEKSISAKGHPSAPEENASVLKASRIEKSSH